MDLQIGFTMLLLGVIFIAMAYRAGRDAAYDEWSETGHLPSGFNTDSCSYKVISEATYLANFEAIRDSELALGYWEKDAETREEIAYLEKVVAGIRAKAEGLT